MTERIPSLLLVHNDMSTAKALAAQLVKEEDIYIYLANAGARAQEFLPSVSIDLIIATQELPDTTGIALFTELSDSYPLVMRVLLVPGEPDSDVRQALENGVIHQYLREPVKAGVFVETVKRCLREEGDARLESPLIYGASESFPSTFPPTAEEDVEKFENPEDELLELLPADIVTDGDATAPPGETSTQPDTAAEAYKAGAEYDEALRLDLTMKAPDIETPPPQDSLAPLFQTRQPPEESIGPAAEDFVYEDVEYTDTDTGPAQNEHFETMPSPGIATEQEERIRDLEAFRDKMSGEIGELHNAVFMLQNELTGLADLRDENTRLSDLNTRLFNENESMERQVVKMEGEIDQLQNELAKAQEAMERHASTCREPLSPAPYQGFQPMYGLMDIYANAEELQLNLSKEQRLNLSLELEVRKREHELAQAGEELGKVRQNLETAQKQCQKELRNYQQHCLSLQQEVKAYESRCGQMERENIELSEKLNWIQAKWGQLLNSLER